jgi:hypothetical protein
VGLSLSSTAGGVIVQTAIGVALRSFQAWVVADLMCRRIVMAERTDSAKARPGNRVERLPTQRNLLQLKVASASIRDGARESLTVSFFTSNGLRETLRYST